MANFTVVYDACVFYPAPLRDLLIRLAMTRRFRARWTTQIHEEWTRNLLANRRDLCNPPVSAKEFVANIRRQGLPSVADFFEKRIDLI